MHSNLLPSGEAYAQRQRNHYRQLLEDSWGCDTPEHDICVITKDKQEFPLSNKHIERWIDCLCKGTCTTSAPPAGTFEDINGGPVWNRHDGTMEVHALDIPPRRDKASRASSSVYSQSIRHSIGRFSLQSGVSGPTASTSGSSGAQGPGHHYAKALVGIGKSVISIMENAATTSRANTHLNTIRAWRARHPPRISPEDRQHVVMMLADAINMSLPCFKWRIRESSFQIGKSIQAWLAEIPNLEVNRENSVILVQVHTCILPLLLNKIGPHNTTVTDLAWQLTRALLQSPLGYIDLDLLDPEFDSNHVFNERWDTPSIAIVVVTRELAYSKCSDQHPWLGPHLLRLVETTLRLRRLSKQEMSVIWELAERRKENNAPLEALANNHDSRPWEIPLFTICAKDNPDFKVPVLAPTGLPRLIKSLQKLLDAPLDDRSWENIVLTVRCLTFISKYEWITEEGALGEDTIEALVRIVRLRIPKSSFLMHYWAIDTLRNVIAHEPHLARLLIQHNLDEPITFVINSSEIHRRNLSMDHSEVHSGMSEPSTPPRQRRRRTSPSSPPSPKRPSFNRTLTFSRTSSSKTSETSTTSSTGSSKGNDQHRLSLYLDEAAKRADELSAQIRNWTNFYPDALPPIKLQVSSDWASSIFVDTYFLEVDNLSIDETAVEDNEDHEEEITMERQKMQV